MEDISKYVGRKIREFRKESNLTQKQLGDKVGVKHNTISSYEKGTNDAELEILFAMANVFDKSIDDFFPSTTDGDPLEQALSATNEKELSSEDLYLIKQIAEKALQLEGNDRERLMNNIKLAVNFFDNSDR